MATTQGIVTRYMCPTNRKGSRIKALARKASSRGPEMSKTIPLDHSLSTQAAHTKAALELAIERGWAGLWVAGGAPSEDGYMFVNLGAASPSAIYRLGVEREDWFVVENKA